jgi:hypothetical protein
MKFASAFAFLAVLVLSTCASAGIIGVACYNDGDGAIDMKDWWHSDLSATPEEVDVYLNETLRWSPAHALVAITTDTPADPTARFTKEVDNATTDPWIGYLINVVRSGPFAITSATEPIGWDTPVITAPVLQLSGIYAGQYLGTVNYAAGTGAPVPVGGTGVFKLTTTFAGSSTFTLEQIPVMNPIPEPATITLLVLGALGGLAFYKRR